jgi:hypothetical protein
MKLRGPKAHPNRPQKAMVCPTHLRRQARAAQQLLESGIASQEVVFGRRFQHQRTVIAWLAKQSVQPLEHFPIVANIPVLNPS